MVSQAKHFTELEVTDQHKIRKKAKQLRYCIEFISSLYPRKNVQQFLKHLQPLQNTLGFITTCLLPKIYLTRQLNMTHIFGLRLGGLKPNSLIYKISLPKHCLALNKPKRFGKVLKVAAYMSRLFIGIYQILSIRHYLLMGHYNYRYAAFLAYRGHRQV